MSAPVRLNMYMVAQPTDSTCGPTCLQAVYRHFGDELSLEQIAAGIETLPNGGTLAVFLANHALRRGYRATTYTYNLHMFDPTWFAKPGVDVSARLREQARWKKDYRLAAATPGYLEYLALGGILRLEDLTSRLIIRILARGWPIITGLSSTFLYHCMREYGPSAEDDDIRGEPQGHFVVLCGNDPQRRVVQVADPYSDNPYDHRLIGAIFLGIVTHDANLLVLKPPARHQQAKQA